MQMDRDKRHYSKTVANTIFFSLLKLPGLTYACGQVFATEAKCFTEKAISKWQSNHNMSWSYVLLVL